MPSSGPSKDELRDYWTNNRQYFDELAKYYLESDRDYYNKYIAPFYSSPFGSTSTSGNSGSGARSSRIILIAVALFGVIGAGAVALLVMMQSGPDRVESKKITSPPVIQDTIIKPEIQTKEQTDTSTGVTQSNSPYYDKAMKYYRNRNFDAAEKYLKLIEENDKNYNNAQKKLMEIKFIRSALENRDEQKNSNRKKPIERIR